MMAPVNTIIANYYLGDDIGAQINAAQAGLNGQSTVVMTLPGDYSIDTQIVVEEGVTLRLGAGTYDNTIVGPEGPGIPVILMKDSTVLESDQRRGARLVEPLTYANICITVADFSRSIGGDAPGNKNITVRDILFVKREGNTATGVTGAIHFGNCENVTVERCDFEGNAGYAMTAGGSPELGHYADGVRFVDCLMTDVQAQNIAVVNATNILISGNVMRRFTAETAQTFIDVETNVPEDVATNFIIVNNIISAGGGAPFTASSGIAVIGGKLPTSPANAARGVIANNCIDGTKAGDLATYLVAGVVVSLAQNVLVTGNMITGCGQGGINLVACQDLEIVGNSLTECGQAPPPLGAAAFGLYGCLRCNVHGNSLRSITIVPHTPLIFESGDEYYGYLSDHNVISSNKFFWEQLNGYIPAVVTTGDNTRVSGNVYQGRPVDDSALTNVADLKAVPYPGTRGAASTPVVRLSGLASVGDGGAATWTFDYASSENENSVTFMAPTAYPPLVTTGRWIRSPQFPKMTEVARDALTLGAGDASFTIYNTTGSMVQTWDGSAWQDHW